MLTSGFRSLSSKEAVDAETVYVSYLHFRSTHHTHQGLNPPFGASGLSVRCVSAKTLLLRCFSGISASSMACNILLDVGDLHGHNVQTTQVDHTGTIRKTHIKGTFTLGLQIIHKMIYIRAVATGTSSEVRGTKQMTTR